MYQKEISDKNEIEKTTNKALQEVKKREKIKYSFYDTCVADRIKHDTTYSIKEIKYICECEVKRFDRELGHEKFRSILEITLNKNHENGFDYYFVSNINNTFFDKRYWRSIIHSCENLAVINSGFSE